MMALSHFFDTEFGGSAHGRTKHGITRLGKDLVARMEQLGILLDLAHASEALIDDALAASTQPVVTSHSGVQAVCNNVRNLNDGHIRGIAATGGLIAIAYFEPVGGICRY
jgi:microsomal dipeptidase-like Zn-dependent dipeptidase